MAFVTIKPNTDLFAKNPLSIAMESVQINEVTTQIENEFEIYELDKIESQSAAMESYCDRLAMEYNHASNIKRHLHACIKDGKALDFAIESASIYMNGLRRRCGDIISVSPELPALESGATLSSKTTYAIALEGSLGDAIGAILDGIGKFFKWILNAIKTILGIDTDSNSSSSSSSSSSIDDLASEAKKALSTTIEKIKKERDPKLAELRRELTDAIFVRWGKIDATSKEIIEFEVPSINDFTPTLADDGTVSISSYCRQVIKEAKSRFEKKMEYQLVKSKINFKLTEQDRLDLLTVGDLGLGSAMELSRLISDQLLKVDDQTDKSIVDICLGILTNTRSIERASAENYTKHLMKTIASQESFKISPDEKLKHYTLLTETISSMITPLWSRYRDVETELDNLSKYAECDSIGTYLAGSQDSISSMLIRYNEKEMVPDYLKHYTGNFRAANNIVYSLDPIREFQPMVDTVFRLYGFSKEDVEVKSFDNGDTAISAGKDEDEFLPPLSMYGSFFKNGRFDIHFSFKRSKKKGTLYSDQMRNMMAIKTSLSDTSLGLKDKGMYYGYAVDRSDILSKIDKIHSGLNEIKNNQFAAVKNKIEEMSKVVDKLGDKRYDWENYREATNVYNEYIKESSSNAGLFKLSSNNLDHPVHSMVSFLYFAVSKTTLMQDMVSITRSLIVLNRFRRQLRGDNIYRRANRLLAPIAS